jgi:hypothetical protein
MKINNRDYKVVPVNWSHITEQLKIIYLLLVTPMIIKGIISFSSGPFEIKYKLKPEYKFLEKL